MREILFRGQTSIGKWVEGSLHIEYGETTKDGKRNTDYRILGMRGECSYVLHETIGQYTGWTDKNGKRIFEGDIIDTPDRLIKVVWFERNAQFDLNFIKHAHDKKIINFKGIEMRDLKEYEVIGNIHDNPELLKEGVTND